MFPSIDYRAQPLAPTFGSPTARANFCEQDFVIVSWIAEFVNTCSNAAYILYAIRALRRMPTSAPFAAKSIYYGLALVGICSSLFHGLLKYHAQMADDTSMIIATSIVLHRAMTYQRSDSYSRWFGGLLVLAAITETAYHTIKDEQIVHELSFVVLIIVVASKTRSLIKLRVHNPLDKQMLQNATIFGAGCFAFGYLLWQLDFISCPQLTALKRKVGIPWGFLFELHGWWHILTAIGAHTFMIMVDGLTSDEVEFSHDAFGWFVKSNAMRAGKVD
ncbi:alkaline phytoceramidase [Aureobasidium melanogenum CBS 110374]|uniref:Alkaline phytoceramidase n=1 Tax=Aureobasidium melanogenum (strain CBS 110374) TaxID=1043003 RepID=A0A074VLZ0_AURM1|nr:alkaline phytoceramidase [Aureobasidium melanogenum CBS 110374]KEQ58682.1 alkaline phytoceramidase [Aureobasidium melanogenum CBS 110374]